MGRRGTFSSKSAELRPRDEALWNPQPGLMVRVRFEVLGWADVQVLGPCTVPAPRRLKNGEWTQAEPRPGVRYLRAVDPQDMGIDAPRQWAKREDMVALTSWRRVASTMQKRPEGWHPDADPRPRSDVRVRPAAADRVAAAHAALVQAVEWAWMDPGAKRTWDAVRQTMAGMADSLRGAGLLQEPTKLEG